MTTPSRARTCLIAGLGCVAGGIVAFIIFIVAVRTTFDRYTQGSSSMAPTLLKGDLVLVRPAQQIKRGDLIVFRFNKELYIKRVVGLPGEIVQLRDNRLFVDRREIEEDYVMFTEGVEALRTTSEIAVPPGEYFALGDNRDNSNDSRFLGTIERENITGKVVFVISQKNGPWRP